MKKTPPQQQYYETIKNLVATHGRGDSGILFKHFETELKTIFLNEFGKILPDVHQDISDEFIVQIYSLIHAYGEEASFAVMPAGEFAVWLVAKLRAKGIQIDYYLDNYKPVGLGADGIPVHRPEAAGRLPVDAILLATPSVRAQQEMASQLRGIIRPNTNIHLSSDTALAMKVNRIDTVSEQRAEIAVDLYNQVATTGAQKRMLLAVPAFPAHYIDIVRALRRKGHRVALLSLSPQIMYGDRVGDAGDQFDFVHTTNNDFLEFFKILIKIRADILYTADFSLWNYFALLLRDLWPGKMFLEVYDFSDNAGLPKGAGVQAVEDCLGIDSQPMEDAARRKLYPAVEGIIYRDSPILVDRARQLYRFETKALHFPPIRNFMRS